MRVWPCCAIERAFAISCLPGLSELPPHPTGLKQLAGPADSLNMANGPSEPSTVRRLQLRFAGKCSVCGTELPRHSWALYDQAAKTVRCTDCPTEDEGRQLLEQGTAGASASREYERRKARREDRVKGRVGDFLGGLLLAVVDEPQSTTAWERGAVGERKLGEALRNVHGLVTLHDRRVPGTRGNIDHVVIGPAGVFVVDSKRYRGLIEVKGRGGLFSSDERLLVGRRDCSHLVENMGWQVEAVRAVLGRAGAQFVAVPVTPVLCFIDGEWPLLFPPSSYRGVRLEGPRSVKRLVTSNSVLSQDEIIELAAIIATQLPPK